MIDNPFNAQVAFALDIIFFICLMLYMNWRGVNG